MALKQLFTAIKTRLETNLTNTTIVSDVRQISRTTILPVVNLALVRGTPDSQPITSYKQMLSFRLEVVEKTLEGLFDLIENTENAMCFGEPFRSNDFKTTGLKYSQFVLEPTEAGSSIYSATLDFSIDLIKSK